MNAIDLILAKRDGGRLSDEQIDWFIRAYTDGTVGDFSIPSEFLQSLPYVVTIIVVAGAIGRALAPAADGVPYERSR